MTEHRHSVQNLFILMLLGFFAVAGTLLITLEAQAYRNSTTRAEEHAAARVAAGYVRTAVRSNDREGAVSVEDGMLVFTAEYEDEAYLTRLYCYDGALMELFTAEDRDFNPEAGERLCNADAFSVSIEGDLLTAVLTEGETEYTVHVALRCAGTEAKP